MEQTKEQGLCSPATSIPGTPSKKLCIASIPEVKPHSVASREPVPILKWTRQTGIGSKLSVFKIILGIFLTAFQRKSVFLGSFLLTLHDELW